MQFSQGGIGDCGVVSGINAVAGVAPALLAAHIHHTGDEANGTAVYAVTLFLDAWRDVEVDATLPDNVAHTNDGSAAQWEALYEKAIAQAAGGYSNVIGMNTTTVIHELTGVDAQQVTD